MQYWGERLTMDAKEKAVSVLVVDDNLVNLELLVDVLEVFGYETITASDGSQCLTITRQQKPSIILLDINMPDMSGYEVCERLKAEPETEAIPIIFVSALNDANDIAKGFDVGGADYITKPFKAGEVVARIEKHLNSN